ncbi:M1 family aminopeptidase [Chryseobacterium sp. JUb7]|uniref:M1 family aminopeptidase n=1 Tax=Chryseobacterium sp. JUb7 TaxID=2940599 RepID=UPI002166F3B3|nr:M1 family aminopeptidase [Chryseobacterium sp. JUb7]MCS3531716.1 putative metalloprotease with PDZ domain [Chryseobacterium sp. JUb7]
MFKKFLFIFILLPFYSFSQNKINYKVFYDKNLEENGLKIQVEYTVPDSAKTAYFHYSNSNWGEENLFKSLIIKQEDNPQNTFETHPEKDEIKIRPQKGGKISFIYHIKQDFSEPSHHVFNRPRVKNNFFHVLGKNLFIVPKSFTEMPENETIDISIEWVNFPEKFKVHNTFGTQIKKQRIKTSLWQGFYHSLFVGGDYRIYGFRFHEKQIYFAIRDQWHNGFTDDFLFSNLKKAIQSQRDFWKDYSQDYFTVIMTPTVSQDDELFKGYSTKGSAIQNAFMIHGTNNLFNNKNSYLYLLHHELMHDWIGNKIQNKNEELNYWFSEGFTDYYTYKNRLRIKDISFDEWVSLFNTEILAGHWKNPSRNIPNYKIKDDFWKNRNIEKIPYRLGAIFAFWLDNQIMIKSNYTKSLDNLMRELLVYCTKNKIKFSDEIFLDLVAKYLNQDISYFFQKHIISGEDIELVSEKWIDCFMFKIIDNIPQLELKENSEVKYPINN